MTNAEKEKLFAAAKIAVGMARIGSAVAMATGHGLLGGLTRSPAGMRAAAPLFKRSVLGGKDMIVAGVAEFKAAK